MIPEAALDPSAIPGLVEASQEGDTEAFAQLYDHYFPQVYRYTAFRVQAEIAEDLVADVFVKVWEKLHTYKAQKNVPFGAWVFRIARHTLIDSYRTKREWDEVPEDILDVDELNHADSRVRRDERLTVIRRAMDQLPRRYRDVLALSYIADLPHSEVARVLRISEGSVRILKHRALKKLEGYLPPEARDSV